MCPAIDAFGLMSETHWNSAYYSAMAGVSKGVESVKQKTRESLPLPMRFWLVERDLRSLVDLLKNPAKAKNMSDSASEPPVDIHTAVRNLESLVQKLDGFYESCQKLGYTNRTLYAGSLVSIRRHAEFIGEVAEQIKLILDPQTEQAFEDAHQEYLRGESVGLEAIF
jgi:hypothetical protein